MDPFNIVNHQMLQLLTSLTAFYRNIYGNIILDFHDLLDFVPSLSQFLSIGKLLKSASQRGTGNNPTTLLYKHKHEY